MARPKSGGGRVTPPDQRRTTPTRGDLPSSADDSFPPLYKRKPGMFAFMILACAAMVLSMAAGIFTAL